MSIKKTTKIFKEEINNLLGNKFTVLSDYVNNKTNVLFRCNNCNYEFTRQPQHILNGRNKCPNCEKRKTTKRKTTEEFKKEVYNLYKDEYTVLGEYINNKTEILIRHNKCNNTFNYIPHYFINQGNKCPYCYKNKLKTTEEFKKEVYKLVGDEYTVLGEYINNKTEILIRHNKCKNEYYVTPNRFIAGNRCPNEKGERISKSRTITEEEYINNLKKRFGEDFFNQYEFIGPYINNNYKIKVKHKKCGKSYYVATYNFLKNNCPYCSNNGKPSVEELSLYEYIKSIYTGEIIQSKKFIANNISFELDIFIPEFNVGFEFDGLYWHSNKFKDKTYHINKTNFFKDIGISIYHIFEDEWINNTDIVKDKINYILHLNNVNNKIFARKCYIKLVSSKDKKEFMNNNHLQGNDKSNIRLGLYYNDELVACMTFCKPRKALGIKNDSIYDYELSRYATKLGYSVIGGFSKLLKYFNNNYDFNTIITYADLRWSNGNLYKLNGFKFDHISKPNYWYFKQVNKRFHRYNFRKQKLKELFPDIYSDDKTEMEIMEESNYKVIYDCGNLVFTYNKII